MRCVWGDGVISVAPLTPAPRLVGTQLDILFSSWCTVLSTCHPLLGLQSSVTEVGWGFRAGTCLSADN